MGKKKRRPFEDEGFGILTVAQLAREAVETAEVRAREEGCTCRFERLHVTVEMALTFDAGVAEGLHSMVSVVHGATCPLGLKLKARTN